MISGFAQLWLIDCGSVPAPTDLHGKAVGPPQEPDEAKTWFQGHLVTKAEQYAILGVPSLHKPPVHGCMVGEHSMPSFYDIYFCQSGKDGVAFCALGVERHSGSGDAVELDFPGPSVTGRSPADAAQDLTRLRFSTTKMISGERARIHLEKYAPDALQLCKGPAASADFVVCLGAMMAISS
ncbi:hypothetical protein GGI23_001138 [Coemansia sp. RSA 2559]|nr:hypothetical protein GGI23_001138 [Coemansia sp. RSA 2559]